MGVKGLMRKVKGGILPVSKVNTYCHTPQVRAMWRSLEGFYDKSSHQRGVVSSVLHGQVDEHAIDGKDIVFQVCMYVIKRTHS